MGGQACILYGAAEFSRDAGFCRSFIIRESEPPATALDHLEATVIAVPPFEMTYLERGHAIHFRAQHAEAKGFRIDVMARMRGVDPFQELWARRTTLSLPDDDIEVLSLPDLVASKKTQRDKDWVMVRRLIEASYARDLADPTEQRIEFWLAELRTSLLLMDCAQRFPRNAERVSGKRPAVEAAVAGNESAVGNALMEEETRERELDRAYWASLRAELQAIRHSRGPENE